MLLSALLSSESSQEKEAFVQSGKQGENASIWISSISAHGRRCHMPDCKRGMLYGWKTAGWLAAAKPEAQLLQSVTVLAEWVWNSYQEMFSKSGFPVLWFLCSFIFISLHWVKMSSLHTQLWAGSKSLFWPCLSGSSAERKSCDVASLRLKKWNSLLLTGSVVFAAAVYASAYCGPSCSHTWMTLGTS